MIYEHACRIVKEGRGSLWAIQTREPGDRWRRYSGGFRTYTDAEATLLSYRESGWFPQHMKTAPAILISKDEAARSALP